MLLPSNLHKYRICGIGISIPIFLTSTFLVLLFYMMSTSDDHTTPAPAAPPLDFHFEYTVQKGFFLQSEDSTDDTTFDFKKQNFGLIDRGYPTDVEGEEKAIWRRFERYVRSVVASAKEGESFKVLFLGRHGQGWHNVAETKYGTKAWDCYYSALDGYDNLTWADATLTPLGEQQATDVNTLWSTQLQHGLPSPESYYVSPLTRAIQTADLTFSTLPLPYTPHIKDPLREALGVHTCDRRSTLSHLRTAFPHLVFDPSFPDPDTLWRPDYREPRSARKYRLETLLDDVFANDGGVFVSLTSHSGAIGSILEAVGHRAFRLETGGVVPVFLRGVRVQGERRVPEWEPSEAGPMCDGPPEGV